VCPVEALIVVAIVVAVNQLEGDVLQPIVLGRTPRLHPLIILFALTAGTGLLGITGAVLAGPIAPSTRRATPGGRGPGPPARPRGRQARPVTTSTDLLLTRLHAAGLTDVRSVEPASGGLAATAGLAHRADGTTVFVKAFAEPPSADAFAAEAEGLDALRTLGRV